MLAWGVPDNACVNCHQPPDAHVTVIAIKAGTLTQVQLCPTALYKAPFFAAADPPPNSL